MGAAAREVRILPDAEAVSGAAAVEFVQFAAEAVSARGQFMVALSGGSTPRTLYSLLGSNPEFRASVPWKKIDFFWGDERYVLPSHEDSNYRMAYEAMLSKVETPTPNIHRVHTESASAEEAARVYEEDLRRAFGLAPGQLPRFDLVLLGIGTDGHTASLFPGTSAVHETVRLVAANWVEKLKSFRITLTPPVLNHAACAIFLVVGADKAEALKEVLEGNAPVDRYPAKIVQPRAGRLLWLVDRASASRLS